MQIFILCLITKLQKYIIKFSWVMQRFIVDRVSGRNKQKINIHTYFISLKKKKKERKCPSIKKKKFQRDNGKSLIFWSQACERKTTKKQKTQASKWRRRWEGEGGSQMYFISSFLVFPYKDVLFWNIFCKRKRSVSEAVLMFEATISSEGSNQCLREVPNIIPPFIKC